MGKLKDLLYNDKSFSKKDYKVSKTSIVINGAAENCGITFISGSYLAALLKYMGAGESLSNFIISTATLMGIFLVLIPYITANMNYKKPFVMLCALFEHLPLALAFLLPIITGNTMLSVVIAAVLFVVHSIALQIKTPIFQDIILNSASGDGGETTTFFGIKDGISNIVLIAAYLSLGIMTSYFVGEREGTGYTIMAVVAIVAWLIKVVSLLLIKEKYRPVTTKVKASIFKTAKKLMSYKPYKPYLIFNIFYALATYSVSSLLFVMCVQRLNMRLEVLSYFTVADLVLRTFFAIAFGKLAEKIGTKPVVAFGILAFSINSGLHLFMNLENAYILKGISVLFSAIAYSSIGAPGFIYMFESLPKENTGEYIACHNILLLASVAVVSMLSAAFIDMAEGFSVNIFGMNFSEMNLVFLFSMVIYVIAAAYLFKQIRKPVADDAEAEVR